MRFLIITLLLLAITSVFSDTAAVAQNAVEEAIEDVEDADKLHDVVKVQRGKNIHPKLIFPIAALTFVIAFIVIAAQIKRVYAKRRTMKFELAVDELGLEMQPDKTEDLMTELSSFPLFNLGRRPKLRNLITADTDEVSLLIFDYMYITGYGKDKRDNWQTVIAIRSPDLKTPTFHLYPEGFFSKIASAFGGQDIDFADHPEFSKAFILKSETEDETRDFFDRSLLDFFAKRPKISFEARSGISLYFRSRKRIEPTAQALREFMKEGLFVFHAVRDRAKGGES